MEQGRAVVVCERGDFMPYETDGLHRTCRTAAKMAKQSNRELSFLSNSYITSIVITYF